MMMKRSEALRRPALLAALAFLAMPAQTALATMELPGGDVLLNGAFNEIEYGATPGLAYATPFLFVSELGATDAPDTQAAVSDLAYEYTVAGLGTSVLTVTYSITNEGLNDFTDLRFMMDVQADGSGSFNDTATATWPAASAGDPDRYQIADFLLDNLVGDIQSNNGLDDSDSCGGAVCDVDFALQWNIPELMPDEVWQIAVALSDDGTASSGRYLTATSFDTADTELTFSGTSRVVPEPGTGALLAGALAVLLARPARRRRS